MATKRVASGRLDRVDQRRRSRQWRIVLGVGAAVVVVVFVGLALHYKGRSVKKKTDTPRPPATAATVAATPLPPPTAETPRPEGGARLLVVNGTKIPQRYGNALAALEQLNVQSGNPYRITQHRPKLPAGDKTKVFYRGGFETQGRDVAKALGGVENARVDLTVTCGQDVSKLILEAMAKNAPAPTNVTVEVLNGSGIEGAAGKMRERLEANGYKVVGVGNAASFDFKRTVIEAPADYKDAAVKLAALFGLGDDAVEPSDFDVKAVVGDDFAGGPAPGI